MVAIRKIQKGIMGVGITVACLLGFTVLISLMLLSTPQDIGPAGVTLWFLLFFVSFASLFMLISMARLRRKQHNDLQKYSLRILRNGVVPAGALVLLLAMSSLGSLGLNDVLLVLATAGIIELYFYTSSRRAAE